jgi:hypothetical protein
VQFVANRKEYARNHPPFAQRDVPKIGEGYAQRITRHRTGEEANSQGDEDSQALDKGWQLKP